MIDVIYVPLLEEIGLQENEPKAYKHTQGDVVIQRLVGVDSHCKGEEQTYELGIPFKHSRHVLSP